MNFRDITKFFRIRSSSAFLDLTNRGLNLIPGEYISEALSLILRADVFLNKQKITDKEQEELIYISISAALSFVITHTLGFNSLA